MGCMILGYKALRNLLLTECAFGRFGINCSNECHCYRNASCDYVNGACSNGMCAPGWEGTTCSKGMLIISQMW